MLSILGFLAILFPLVVVHEFGHFIFAKLFKVKAEIFSVGFGKPLWSKKWGETEYRYSLIPLGGYVKLLGEDPELELSEEEKKRALPNQAPWKRFFIFFGGPLFNFIWAAIVYMAILAIGNPQLASVAGRVIPGSPAEQAGLRSGDRILEINGAPMKLYADVAMAINESPNKPMVFKIDRGAPEGPIELNITPTPKPGYSMYGEEKNVGEIKGLYPNARSLTVGVSDPSSRVGQIGLKTGDEILKINGQEKLSWESFVEIYKGAKPEARFELVFKMKKGGKQTHEFTKPVNSSGDLGADFGLYSSELFIDQTIPDSPAATAGIQPKDRIVSIDGQKLPSFYALKDLIQTSAAEDGKVEVSWEREGVVKTAMIEPTATKERDPLLNKVTHYTIGVVPMLIFSEPVTVVERVWNPFVLAYRGTAQMLDMTWKNVVAIGKMFSGDVSIKTLGGPILIGKIAGASIQRGLISFLTTMAILSVGLGILNIMPIPVLDGGHLMLLAIETVRGKPLTLRQMEIVQQVGLSLILLLMVIVIRNDLARVLPIFN